MVKVVTSMRRVKPDKKQVVYRALVSFANILDPDHACQNDGPDLNPKCLKR